MCFTYIFKHCYLFSTRYEFFISMKINKKVQMIYIRTRSEKKKEVKDPNPNKEGKETKVKEK